MMMVVVITLFDNFFFKFPISMINYYYKYKQNTCEFIRLFIFNFCEYLFFGVSKVSKEIREFVLGVRKQFSLRIYGV